MSSMAAAGVKLTQYYGQEMCTPARAALMSGRWPSSTNFADSQITQWSTNRLPLRYAPGRDLLTGAHEALGRDGESVAD